MHCAMASVVPGARLAAVADRRKAVTGYLRGLGIEAPFFSSVSNLLADRSLALHGAIVATPQSLHRVVAEECLRAGLGVLVEKPLAHHLDDAEAMVRLAGESPTLPAGVAYMKAHYPVYRRLKQLLDGRILGDIRKVKAKSLFGQVLRPHRGWIYEPRHSGGGALINSACHMLQILHFLFGPARTVDAETRSVHSREVEDEAEVRVRFRNGIVADGFASWSTPGYETEYTEITIEADNGRILATDDWFEARLESAAGDLPAGTSLVRQCDLTQAEFNLSPDYGGEGYYLEVLDFVDSLRTPGRQPAVTWRDGREVQRTLHAAYQSARGRGEVEVG